MINWNKQKSKDWFVLKTGKDINGKVVITSSLHGDEITGVMLLDNLLSNLEQLSRKLRVKIIVVPFVNFEGIKKSLREDPISKKDLNRCFFEKKAPDQIKKLKKILAGASFGVDLHCFPHTKHALTGLLFVSKSKKEISEINKNAIAAFNPDMCWRLDFKELDKEKKGSMGEWLIKNDIPGFAIETDSPEFLSDKDIKDISKRLLRGIEVGLGKSLNKNGNMGSLRRIVVKVKQPGIFIPSVKPLQIVRKNQRIGRLIDFNLHKTNISSPVAGKVIFSKVIKFVNKEEKLVGIGIK